MIEEITSQAAVNEAIQGAAIGIMFTAIFGTIVFFIQRFIAQKDEQEKEVSQRVDEVAEARHRDLMQLTKDIGLLEAAKQRSLEADVRFANEQDKLKAEVRELENRILALEFNSRMR